MRGKNFYYATLIVGITAVLTVAITLKLSRSRSVTPVPAALDASLVARATTPADEYRGAQKEGIKVHGHWTIDVRNPDGKLASHQEFENALVTNGAVQLSAILARRSTTGLWQIRLPVRTGFTSPWSAGEAIVIEPADTGLTEGINITKTLTVNTGGTLSNPSTVLNGNITAERVGMIGTVSTDLKTCAGTVAAANCLFANHTLETAFTWVDLPMPVNGTCSPNTACAVNVVAGQIVQVKVTFTFS